MNERRKLLNKIKQYDFALNELAKILTAENTELYERLITDMGETGIRFQKWWDHMATQYNWESDLDGHWEINFDTCEIFLITPDA